MAPTRSITGAVGRTAIMLVTAVMIGCGKDPPPPATPEPPAEPEQAEANAEKPVEPESEYSQAHADFTAQLHSLLDAIEAEASAEAAPADAPPTQPMAKAPEPTEAPPAATAAKTRTYKQMIIGQWQLSQGGRTMSMTFKADGTIEIDSEAMAAAQVSFSATYEWDSDDAFTVSISITGPDGNTNSMEQAARVKSMDDSSMTLVISQGGSESEQTFSRAAN